MKQVTTKIYKKIYDKNALLKEVEFLYDYLTESRKEIDSIIRDKKEIIDIKQYSHSNTLFGESEEVLYDTVRSVFVLSDKRGILDKLEIYSNFIVRSIVNKLSKITKFCLKNDLRIQISIGNLYSERAYFEGFSIFYTEKRFGAKVTNIPYLYYMISNGYYDQNTPGTIKKYIIRQSFSYKFKEYFDFYIYKKMFSVESIENMHDIFPEFSNTNDIDLFIKHKKYFFDLLEAI